MYTHHIRPPHTRPRTGHRTRPSNDKPTTGSRRRPTPDILTANRTLHTRRHKSLRRRTPRINKTTRPGPRPTTPNQTPITIHSPARNHTRDSTRTHRARRTARHVPIVVGTADCGAGAAEPGGAEVVARVKVGRAGVAELAPEEVVCRIFGGGVVGEEAGWDVVF